MIGYGERISILNDSWIFVLPLSTWPTFLNMDIDAHGWNIKYFITPKTTWNPELLEAFFLEISDSTNH